MSVLSETSCLLPEDLKRRIQSHVVHVTCLCQLVVWTCSEHSSCLQARLAGQSRSMPVLGLQILMCNVCVSSPLAVRLQDSAV